MFKVADIDEVIFEAEGIDELCGKVMLDMQELCRKMIL
jgi:hypothetical protein